MEATETRVGFIEVDLEFEINAPRERVWKAFTEETDTWWHEDFYMIAKPSTVTFEPRAGGKLMERNAKGESLLWYTVIWVVPQSHISFVGHMSPPATSPATTHMQVNFEDLGGGKTKLKVTDLIYGVVSEKLKNDMTEGWRIFYTDAFIPYVEGR